jgi:sulfhydrogenase subunit beta (sulfur reductase)
MADSFLDVGTTISIKKVELENIFAKLKRMNYELVGSRVKDHTVVHAPITEIADLPIGYTSKQEPGQYQLVKTDNLDYFGVTAGPHSWKQYFFPPKSELMRFHKANDGESWSVLEENIEPPQLALIGVRPCDLAAIQIQDNIFMREEWCDPAYRNCRTNAFIVAVNCMEPCGTCFCTSMGTGPQAEKGFDLCLTELDENFLVEVGSEAGRMVLSDETITWKPASAFLLLLAQNGLEDARETISRELPAPEVLRVQLLENLDHPQWDDIATRCLSCTSCTQVCPTCFCWDTYDNTLLPGDVVIRERVWDSCFNPDYTYVFGGNTRPNTRSRYRQWLTHKFASWYDQFGVSGCVGCGRCITWCPAGIDHVEEISKICSVNIQEGAIS